MTKKETESVTDWISSDNQVGSDIVLPGDVVLSIHYRVHKGKFQYALVKWWYHAPTVISVVERGDEVYHAEGV